MDQTVQRGTSRVFITSATILLAHIYPVYPLNFSGKKYFMHFSSLKPDVTF